MWFFVPYGYSLAMLPEGVPTAKVKKKEYSTIENVFLSFQVLP